MDIFDLQELNQAYLARWDAHARGPETRGQRTEIPQSDRLSTVDEILRARGCFSSNDSDRNQRNQARDVLKAAVKMASDDATLPGWVRTREQIDGGSYLPNTLSDDTYFDFLIEYDLAMSEPLSKAQLESAVKHETMRWRRLQPHMKIAFAMNIAQRHNFVDQALAYLNDDGFVEEQTVQTIELIKIAAKEIGREPGTSSAPETPAASTLGTAGIPATASSTRNTLRKGQPLPQELARVYGTYAKAGRDITTCLVTFMESKIDSWTESERSQIKCLYKAAQPSGDIEYCWKSCSAFEKFACKARESGWKMDDEVADSFITAIKGRRQLRDWYDRLPSDDSRFESNGNHEFWLQTLIKVVIILAGHKRRPGSLANVL